ncbi:MAG: prolyl oligopeptidase family serine peptidase [Proteobacteria bacterium]|nr:prolyl oligopeptidase family serine peptidase [Pseudomonadota bacterium]
MMQKPIIWILIVLSAVACGSSQEPEVAVLPPMAPNSSSSHHPNVISEFARIFGDPPVVGRIPRNLSWSPDSSVVAYIRISDSAEGEPVQELWLHETASQRERPLFSDPKMSVSGYDWCGKDRLVLSLDGDLLLVDLAGKRRRLTKTGSSEEGAQGSPDGTKVAFVRDHNLFVLDVETGREQQISQNGTEDKSYGDVTWIYEEEFSVGAGFGWSPDSKRIWFYYTDESNVTKKNIVTDSQGSVRLQTYPKPGESNPVVRVGVVDLGTPSRKVAWLATGKETDIYLPEITWHPDSKRLLVVRLDRLQTMLDLLVCTVSSGCSTILSERDPRWVNLLGPPKFIRKGEEFLWLSERNGFSHIYRFGMDGAGKGQITNGKYIVTSIDAVDEDKGAVFFTANADEPSAYGIYRVSISDNDVELISEEPGVHKVVFSPDIEHYLDTHSALDRPPRTDIRSRSGEHVALVARSDLREYRRPDVTNDIFPIETQDGETLMAFLTRPTALDVERRYPVLISVYGGPHVQLAKNVFISSYQPWRELMASRGILVFSVDGRGSYGRGHEFEVAIHRRLGEVELADQLAGVAYLKTLPFVDPDRIAIFGSSYGGTMALNAVLRTKNIFKVGVAFAPVTDWRQYDTAYTERYMQRPEDNPKGYRDTSLLPLVDRLQVPLLLVHGLADDNVQFANSALLVDALVEAGKEFEVMFYPGKNHHIRDAETQTHLFSRIVRFIERYI